MCLIKDITEKFDGVYKQELTKYSYTPDGKLSFTGKSGRFIFNGYNFEITIMEASGIGNTEPYKIIMHLPEDMKINLEVFPKSNFSKVVNWVLGKITLKDSNLLNRRFTFKGNKNLINYLKLNSTFMNLISNERIYIHPSNVSRNRLILVPEFGINNVDHGLKLLSILAEIRNFFQK